MSPNTVRGIEPGKRVAVVIHEWQRFTVDPERTTIPGLAAHAVSQNGTDNINRLTEAARAVGMPVFWSTIEPRADRVGTAGNSVLLAGVRKGGLVAGTEETDLHPALKTDPDRDIWIRRVHGLTPFHGTELEPYLREQGIETVVICGVSVDIGITGAALEAINRGFSVVVPSDCTAASSPGVHAYITANQLRLVATISDADSVATALASIGANA
jgi:nicotinamidase-related amidase